MRPRNALPFSLISARDALRAIVIGTMTDMARSNRIWRGETGFINQEMLAKYIGDLAAPIYYIAGPPKMVEAMQKALSYAGVDSDDVRAEEFAGY